MARNNSLTIGQLYRLVQQDYLDNEQKSLGTINLYIRKHLRCAFKDEESISTITTKKLEKYKETRRAEGASQATVNRELSLLRRGLNLCVEKGLHNSRSLPKFNLYRIGNRNRKVGFFEEAEYDRLVPHLPLWARPVVAIGHLVGWRLSEVLSLTWDDHYLADHQELRLWDSKNGEVRVIPLANEDGVLNGVGEIIQQQMQSRVTNCPFIFHKPSRKGVARNISRHTFQKVYTRAKNAAGIVNTFHDFRRTASRNLRNKGFDAPTRMQIIGHKTLDMDLRYGIVNKSDMQRALAAVSRRQQNVVLTHGQSQVPTTNAQVLTKVSEREAETPVGEVRERLKRLDSKNSVSNSRSEKKLSRPVRRRLGRRLEGALTTILSLTFWLIGRGNKT